MRRQAVCREQLLGPWEISCLTPEICTRAALTSPCSPLACLKHLYIASHGLAL